MRKHRTVERMGIVNASLVRLAGAYRDGATLRMFKFGVGLNRWTFGYGAVTIRPAAACQPAVAVATITNTGTHSADEVAQLYIRQLRRFPVSDVRNTVGRRGLRTMTGRSLSHGDC